MNLAEEMAAIAAAAKYNDILKMVKENALRGWFSVRFYCLDSFDDYAIDALKASGFKVKNLNDYQYGIEVIWGGNESNHE